MLYAQPAGEKGALVGFYGQETMGERIEKLPKLRVGGREKKKGVARGGEETETERAGDDGDGEGDGKRRRKKGGRIGGWLKGKRSG